MPRRAKPDYFTGIMPGERRLRAVLYAEGGLSSLLGKTAHGLLRFSPRYEIVAVIDSTCRKKAVPGPRGSVPVIDSVDHAIARNKTDVLVIGIAPTGSARVHKAVQAAEAALAKGVSVHNGLHVFFSEIPGLRRTATRSGASIVDIRKPPARPLRMFTGQITRVKAPRILVTGQDAAIGKRTTCVRLAEQLAPEVQSCLIGTGQTSWLQAFAYGVRLDALPIDFAAGEIEGAVLQAAREQKPDLFIIEGQGSLLNPGYGPETLALLAGTRPSALIYVAAPGRSRFVDFPMYRLPSANREICLLQEISGTSVIGIVINDTDADAATISAVTLDDVPVSFGINGDLTSIAARIRRLVS